jgi:hypothetical protein
MSTENHTLYRNASPYYRSILKSEGRYITQAVVRSILADHGLAESDYLADHDLAELPTQTDASDLVAWLGY